jgi:hypothetical protein
VKFYKTEPYLSSGGKAVCQALSCWNEAAVYLWRVDIYEDSWVIYGCEWCAGCALERLELRNFHLSKSAATAYIATGQV